MRQLASVAVSMVLLASACGGGGNISSPCDPADAAMVQSIFGGNVAEGVEGVALNCSFEVEGGQVVSVDVFWFGSAQAGMGPGKVRGQPWGRHRCVRNRR